MVDALALLPGDHAGFPGALASFQRLSSAVLELQDESGFWRTLLHDRESYLEASTAAFFGAAFTKGVRLGLLNDDYTQSSELAWRAMLSRLDAQGSFYGVSACTYAAVSPVDELTMYRTLPTEVNVWGQGSALRFAAERLRFQTPLEKRAG
jgi:rhamnogalacturonyl hydrolase YesR